MERERRNSPEPLSLPHDPSRLEELAELEWERGSPGNAIELFQRALEIDPTRRRALLRLAELCEAVDDVQCAIDTCVRILQRDPNSADAHMMLGLILSSALRPERRAVRDLDRRDRLFARAMGHLQRAASLNPSAEAFEAWGRALMYAGRYVEAIDRFQCAVELQPRHGQSYENLGRSWLELGNIDAACVSFRTAVAVDSRSYQAHYELAKLEDAESEPSATAVLHELLEGADLKSNERMMLNFALGHRLDSAGQYDAAFERYMLANDEKKARVGMPVDAMKQLTDRSIGLIDASFVSEARAGGSSSDLPIFIVGMPRSGTTLVEQILASHPNVFGGGELYDIPELVTSLPYRLREPQPYPESVASVDGPLAAELANEYLARLRRLISASPDTDETEIVRATDKMPTNAEHLGLIARLFPNSRIIHVRRDPRDVCVSCFKQNLFWPFCDLQAAGHYHCQCERLMEHWRAVLAVPIEVIQYEQLVASPAEESRRLVEFCGLPWNDACLRIADSNRAIRTPSKSQVRQPIHQSSVGAWKRYEKFLGPLMEALERGKGE